MLKIFISLSLLITLTACSSTIRSYKQEGHTDLATVKFSNFYDTKTHELYICQEGNAGFIRLPKDRTVNVKANEPTRILIKINKKKESCSMKLHTSFSPDKSYFISSGITHKSESLAKTLLLGRSRGQCKTLLTDKELSILDFTNDNGFPLSKKRGNYCRHFNSGNIENADKIINADTWIDLNKTAVKTKRN